MASSLLRNPSKCLSCHFKSLTSEENSYASYYNKSHNWTDRNHRQNLLFHRNLQQLSISGGNLELLLRRQFSTLLDNKEFNNKGFPQDETTGKPTPTTTTAKTTTPVTSLETDTHDELTGKSRDREAVGLTPKRNKAKEAARRRRNKNILSQKMVANCIDIAGVSHHIDNEKDLLEEVLHLLRAIDAPVRREDIKLVRRANYWNRDSLVVCHFHDATTMYSVLEHAPKMSRLPRRGNTNVYMVRSMCGAYRNIRFNYLVPLQKAGKIAKFRVGKNWCNEVKLTKDGEWVDVAHRDDLVALGLVDYLGKGERMLGPYAAPVVETNLLDQSR